jgi:nitrite reductase (NADH) small subunit
VTLDTHNENEQTEAAVTTVDGGRVLDTPPGTATTVRLPTGQEIAIYNVNGEFFAIQNSCPHQGAPLAQGSLCGEVIECGLHGWQFDLRTGECFTVTEKIATYVVFVEDDLIKIVV